MQRGVKRGARHHADAEAGHAHAHGVLRSLSVVLRWYRRLWAAVHVPGSFVIKRIVSGKRFIVEFAVDVLFGYVCVFFSTYSQHLVLVVVEVGGVCFGWCRSQPNFSFYMSFSSQARVPSHARASRADVKSRAGRAPRTRTWSA